jgi:hypothetical protein
MHDMIDSSAALLNIRILQAAIEKGASAVEGEKLLLDAIHDGSKWAAAGQRN